MLARRTGDAYLAERAEPLDMQYLIWRPSSSCRHCYSWNYCVSLNDGSHSVCEERKEVLSPDIQARYTCGIRRFSVAETRPQSQGHHYGICNGQIGSVTCFSPKNCGIPCR
jgi:hypothetical protein